MLFRLYFLLLLFHFRFATISVIAIHMGVSVLKSCEKFISEKSDYYIYTPSLTAKEMFFYPLYVGRFFYEKGYSLQRDSYDSFLLMYIKKGSLALDFNESTTTAVSGNCILIDCYRPHAYHSDENCECLWCHFDGPLARRYYEMIVQRLGNVFSITEAPYIAGCLEKIYLPFHQGKAIREAQISRYLTDLLSCLLLTRKEQPEGGNYEIMSEEIIAYINEHFAEEISNEDLAAIAGLSQFHFIRTFRKITGLTPHEYIIDTRINTAKYMLKNTSLSVKDICYRCGFSCESVFCSSFKKNTGSTPAQYRTAANC